MALGAKSVYSIDTENINRGDLGILIELID
jgi:hypothetical protein